MNLTKNFTLEELLRSSRAEKSGFKEQFKPSAEVIANLTALAVHILQPIRDYLGHAIFVSSGYRCQELNAAVKGAKNSQHLKGQAADLQALGEFSNKDIFEAIIAAKLPFDQLLWEFGNSDNPAWVHVSYSSRNRRQILYVK